MLVGALANMGALRTMISEKIAGELGPQLKETGSTFFNVEGKQIKAKKVRVGLRIAGKKIIDEVMIIEDSNNMLLGFLHLRFSNMLRRNWQKRVEGVVIKNVSEAVEQQGNAAVHRGK